MSLLDFLHLLGGNACLADQITRAACGDDLEAILVKAPGYLYDLGLIPVADADKHGSLQRQGRLRGLLGLVEGFAEVRRKSQHFSGGTHLRPEERVYLLEHIEGEDGLLYAVMVEFLFL